ncbi:MAG: DUF427 domain-containing protein [Myxococcota bacterium]
MAIFQRPRPLPAGPGQESVWDYPRPPRIEATSRRLQIRFAGRWIADTRRGLRVLETSHPPTYYLPIEDFIDGSLQPVPGRKSFCEWKGQATYLNIVIGSATAHGAAWTYPKPTPGSGMKPGFVAVYAAEMHECRVDGERVTPQPGGFYGGWITSHVVGPFKGTPGSMGW